MISRERAPGTLAHWFTQHAAEIGIDVVSGNWGMSGAMLFIPQL